MALGIFDIIIMIPHERKYEEICYSLREYIPSCVALGAPTTGGPQVFVKMTSDVCCDDVWWGPYPSKSRV
jgi:hypothetical protein